MIKIGDIVTISPAHSLKFAGLRGRVVAINPKDGLPIKVVFNGQPYGFSPEELVKEDTDGESY
mgnify:FL=1